MKRRAKLMIPGPVEVEPEVLELMARPLVPHYESDWARVHAETVEMAKEVFRTSGDLFIMVGSGSAGLEACLAGIAGNEGRTLIPSNGVFGDLLFEIARSYSEHVEKVQFPWDRPISPEDLDRLLTERGDVRSVAVVHCETHTGILNPVESYSHICRDHGAVLMVDAVSSLGGVRLEMDAWNIDLCVTASQKALGAPPGLCLVAVNFRCWPLLEKRAGGPGRYLNLNTWKTYAIEWKDWHPTISTMAVNNFLALRKALELILKEGLERRFARHERIAGLIRQGVRNLGLAPYADEGFASPTVTTVLLPEGLNPKQLREYVKANHGIMLAGSTGPLREKAFRIGHMGPEATMENALSVLIALEGFLRHIGRQVPVGQSLFNLEPELFQFDVQ